MSSPITRGHTGPPHTWWEGNPKIVGLSNRFIQPFFSWRWFRLAGFLSQRLHVQHETVTDIILQHAFVGLVHLLDWDEFDLGDDVVLGAEIEHLLGLLDATDE